jgi:hypothetical protein
MGTRREKLPEKDGSEELETEGAREETIEEEEEEEEEGTSVLGYTYIASVTRPRAG